MSKDNNKTKKSQVTSQNSNVSNDEFLEYYTKENFWDEHKKNTDSLSNLYNTSNQDKLIRFAERTKYCAEFLTYANRLNFNTGELTKKLVNANFCRVRLCPVCQWRRSLMWQARFYDAIPKIMEKYKNYRFLFLTLTIKNCDVNELAKTLEIMNKSFRKMLKYKRLDFFEGWLKTTEITRNSITNEAHPHFHLLVIVKPSYFKKNYVRQFEFIELWQKALKVDYLPNVDIRTVKNKHSNNKDDLTTAVSELLKYSVKESDLLSDPEFLFALTNEIDKKRFISSGGILKDILKLEKESPEDLLNDEQLDAIESVENEEEAILFKYSRDFYKYKKHKPCSDKQLTGDQDDRRYRIEKAQLKKASLEKQQQRLDEVKKIKQKDDRIDEVVEVKEGDGLWQALQ